MRFSRCLIAFVIVTAISACGEQVEVSDVWPVNGRIAGRDGKVARDLSGLACDRPSGFPRRCVVVDDETQSAQVVILHDGRIESGPVVKLVSDEFAGNRLELDGEGVAIAGGDVYVIGSHGHPRDRKGKLDARRDADEIAAKIAATSRLLRFKLPMQQDQDGQSIAVDVVSSARIREAIAASSVLAPHMDHRLDDNGLTVEGIAVAGNRLYIGFRAPLLEGGKVPVMNVAVEPLFGTGPLDAQLSLLDLGGRGVRDLTILGDVLVILAGPSDDRDGASGLYLWNRTAPPALLANLPALPSDEKPEAILHLDDSPGTMRFLLLSDGIKKGSPRTVVVAAPS